MTFQWTVEKIDRLRELSGCGWSASAIAQDIGASRNAVIGKRWRLGLTKLYRAEKVKREKARFKNCGGVSIEKRTGCCFLVSDGAPHRYCNGKVSAPRSDGMWHYCDAHLTVMRDSTANAKSHHPKAVKYAAKSVDGVYNSQIAKTDAPVFDRVAA